MTLQQLEYIRAIYDYGHFGKAADACGITQPTLSLMVKKLEEELDVTIFNRDAHPVRPTEIGQKVIDKASVVLYNARQLSEMVQSEKQLACGEVKIGMISTLDRLLTPAIFTYINVNYPKVRAIIEEMLSSTVIDKLKKAEIDIGFVSSEVNDPDILVIPFFHENFLAYVSSKSELYQKDEIESSDLLDSNFWIMKSGISRFDKSMLTQDESFSYDSFYEGGRVGTIISIVEKNGGLTIIPELHTREILYSMQKNLRLIVNPPIERHVCICIRKDYIHQKMLNIVIEAAKSVVPIELLEDMVLREVKL